MTRNCRDKSLQMSFQFFGMWRKSIPNWRWWITSPFWCVTFLFVTTTRSYFNRAFLIWLLGTPQKSSAGWNVSRPWPQRFESFWFERRHKYWKHLNLLSLLSANVLHTLRGEQREKAIIDVHQYLLRHFWLGCGRLWSMTQLWAYYWSDPHIYKLPV
jgi:hypothetical protein